MSRSQVTIANRVIDLVGSTSNIISLNQNSKAARAIKRAYDPVLEDLLGKHNWSFAIKRIALNRLSGTLLFGYQFAFQLPNDYIKLIECYPPNTRHSVESENNLLIDAESCEIRYVKKVTDPNAYTPGFAELLAKTIAAQVAYKITASRVTAADLEDKAIKYFRWAASDDSKGAGSPQEVESDVWMINRGYYPEGCNNAIVRTDFDYGHVN